MTPIYKYPCINFISVYFVLFVDVTVIERDRVTERVIVPLVVGDIERLIVTLGVRVNGWVVGIADRLRVMVTERVRLSDIVLDTVTVLVIVGNPDAGTVYRADGLLVTERVSVTETVGLIDRVNGWVVGIADGLRVMVTERVRLSDMVLDTVTELVMVGNPDAGTVYRADGLLVTERDRVGDTVAVMDRVNGIVVTTGLELPVTHLDIVREPVRLTDRVFGQLVATGLGLSVIVTVRLRVGEIVTEIVIPDRVIVAVGQNVLVVICVVGIGVGVSVSDRVFVTLGVKDGDSVLTDFVA